MAGRKHFHFSGILHAAPGADSTPSFIVQANFPQTLDVSFKIKNLSAFPVTFRFLKSQTGSLILGSGAPTRGTWAAVSGGPYTIAKDGELTFNITDVAQRIALSVNEDGQPLCSLAISGISFQDVNAFNGILDAVVDAGGVVVEQGGNENFVYAVDNQQVPVFPP